MENLAYKVGQVVKVGNVNYTITTVELTAEAYPNTKKARPNIEYHIIVQNAKGTLRGGVINTSGKVILF